eukprot:m.136631 g.136631  ORF g.136631 m.136631 type:complete len:128 (-) comp14734_c0_seq11:1267-1650(-)
MSHALKFRVKSIHSVFLLFYIKYYIGFCVGVAESDLILQVHPHTLQLFPSDVCRCNAADKGETVPWGAPNTLVRASSSVASESSGVLDLALAIFVTRFIIFFWWPSTLIPIAFTGNKQALIIDHHLM